MTGLSYTNTPIEKLEKDILELEDALKNADPRADSYVLCFHQERLAEMKAELAKRAEPSATI